jgi:membrane protease YdiL (CAAX protease family)
VERYRVWFALVVPPLALAAAFGVAAAVLAVSGAADVAASLQRWAFLPASVGFAGAFVVLRSLAASDSLTLAALGWTKPSWDDVVIGTVAGAALYGIDAYVLYPLLARVQPSFDPTLAELGLPAACVMMTLGVAAEETVYRGYALLRLRERYGVATAVAITTVFYVLLTPGSELPLKGFALYLGLVLCGLRLWRKNLWPVAIAHLLVSLGPKLAAG